MPIPIIGVFALGSYSDDALPWLQSQFSFAWLCVASLAIVAFCGAYAATEPPPPIKREGGIPIVRRLGGARLGALAALFFSIYLLSVLAWYIEDPDASRRVSEATWWGVPFSLCFWTLAATEIAAETEKSGSGEPADPFRQWRWLLALRNSALARRAAYAVLFGGTIGFAILGSIPGEVWRRPSVGGSPPWRGHGYMTTDVYNFGVTVWAGALLITAFLFLVHSFRARPRGLPGAVLRRAWYSLWASAALVVLMACFGLAAQGLLAEPLIDLALALYALCFVVMLVDASATTKRRGVKSSLRRRVASASGTIGFAFGLAVLIGPRLQPFRTGVLAAGVAAAIPLFPVIHRGLFGIERQVKADHEEDEGRGGASYQIVPLPLDGAERAALYALLLSGSKAAGNPSIDPKILRRWRRGLKGLMAIPPPQARNTPQHPIVFLMFTSDDGLGRTKKWSAPDETIALLEALFPGDLDEQRWELIDMLRRTAFELTREDDDIIYSGPPSAMECLEAEAVARLPYLPEDPLLRERWQRLRDMRREWLFGKALWTGASQPVEKSAWQGKYNQNRGALRAQRLAAACDVVLAHWLANIEAALARDMPEMAVDLAPRPGKQRRKLGRRGG